MAKKFDPIESFAEMRHEFGEHGGVTTTFSYDANGALVKKEDPLVGTTYYVGPHYELLVPAVTLPPAPPAPSSAISTAGPPDGLTINRVPSSETA